MGNIFCYNRFNWKFSWINSKKCKTILQSVTAKFEPIGFDGHYNSNLFQKFLILDFLDIENRN